VPSVTEIVAAALFQNAAVEDLNTAVLVQQQRAANDTSAASESSTWQTYVP